MTVLCVYLPSSDHTLEEYTTYLNELDCIICAYQTQGPVIVAGDFNAHLPNFCLTPNTQGNLVYNLIDRNHLYPVPHTNPSNASNYTFFSGSNKYTSIIDYIFLDAEMAPHLISSKILDHHPLNLSDHLPISISLKIPNMRSRQCHPSSKSINWSKAISSGSIKVYEEKVKLHIVPLLQTALLSVKFVLLLLSLLQLLKKISLSLTLLTGVSSLTISFLHYVS